MDIIRIPIDTKSLYLNIKNDNKLGHTATVSTPLKQGSSVRPELSMISNIPENINASSKEGIISQITEGSRSEAKINRIFVFDKISVNGLLLDKSPSFCAYIREETNPNNIHCGRQKLHYPSSFSYEDFDVVINNKEVLKIISMRLNDYAFIVEAFEYQNGILNFDVAIVGENGIPYSKVFVNKRGVGNKFTSVFVNEIDNYDTEVISLRETLGYENVFPENYSDIASTNQNKAIEIVSGYLEKQHAQKIKILRFEYPYTLFDIEYSINGIKHYAIVQHTATRKKYFTLPISKVRFMSNFSNNSSVFLISDVDGTPQLKEYSASEINELNKTIASITYEDRR